MSKILEPSLSGNSAKSKQSVKCEKKPTEMEIQVKLTIRVPYQDDETKPKQLEIWFVSNPKTKMYVTMRAFDVFTTLLILASLSPTYAFLEDLQDALKGGISYMQQGLEVSLFFGL